MSAINGTTLHWVNVTRATPCPVCDKPDWCRRSEDGDWCRCNRLAEHPTYGKGREKQDAAGATYWVYRLTPWPQRQGAWPEPRLSSADRRGRKADADTLHRVYSHLLDRLALSPRHQDDLLRRGLRRGFKELGYATLPDRGRAQAVRHLIETGLERDLARVPGFFIAHKDGRRYWTVSGVSGLLIPVRDAQQRIVALSIRPDVPLQGRKYLWLSSKRKQGPGPGAPVHVPLFDGDRSVVRVTEGALKADVATHLSGVLTVGLPGVSNWRCTAKLLRELDAKIARIAFDADARRKRLVAESLARLVESLESESFALELEVWEEADVEGH